MRKFASAAVAATLIAAGLAATGTVGTLGASAAAPTAPTGTASYSPPPIDWGRCEFGWLRKAGARCGMLSVPLDYEQPDGRKIRLAVSRIKHSTPDAEAQGVMLVNPGGPGGSGLGLSTLGQYVPHHGGDSYDWIGFDPRGVGSSKPLLACDGAVFAPGRPAYVPDTQEIVDYWQAKAEGYAEDCAAANLPLLQHNDTRTVVQDVESLRKALGKKKINYYGFSYGTYIGQVYATLYPDRVRRFVFDGVVDPQEVWWDLNMTQNAGFDVAIDIFFDWVAANDAAYGLGTDGGAVRQIYYDVLQQLTEAPLPTYGAADWNDTFLAAGYIVLVWDQLAHVLVAAADGNLGPAQEWYGNPTGPGADNWYATYLSVFCSDAAWPQDWETWQQDNDAMHAEHPFFTWSNAWLNMPCRTWPVPPAELFEVDGADAPPILLISETLDAATSFGGAMEVRKRFPDSVLIEGVGGTTHAASLFGTGCVDNRIARYLKTGALPTRTAGDGHSDVACPALAPPEATPPGSARPAYPQPGSTRAAHTRPGPTRVTMAPYVRIWR